VFRRTDEISDLVTIYFEDRKVEAQEGETVAAALLAADIFAFRQSAEDQSLRGPFCMIGNCFECLVEIEGRGSRQACRERVSEGMRVHQHPGQPNPEGGS